MDEKVKFKYITDDFRINSLKLIGDAIENRDFPKIQGKSFFINVHKSNSISLSGNIKDTIKQFKNEDVHDLIFLAYFDVQKKELNQMIFLYLDNLIDMILQYFDDKNLIYESVFIKNSNKMAISNKNTFYFLSRTYQFLLNQLIKRNGNIDKILSIYNRNKINFKITLVTQIILSFIMRCISIVMNIALSKDEIKLKKDKIINFTNWIFINKCQEFENGI